MALVVSIDPEHTASDAMEELQAMAIIVRTVLDLDRDIGSINGRMADGLSSIVGIIADGLGAAAVAAAEAEKTARKVFEDEQAARKAQAEREVALTRTAAVLEAVMEDKERMASGGSPSSHRDLGASIAAALEALEGEDREREASGEAPTSHRDLGASNAAAAGSKVE